MKSKIHCCGLCRNKSFHLPPLYRILFVVGLTQKSLATFVESEWMHSPLGSKQGTAIPDVYYYLQKTEPP